MQNVHFSPKEVAEMLDVNESTIKRWVDKGILNSTKTPGGHRRISQEDFIEFRKAYKHNSKKSYILRRNVSDGNDFKDKWKEYYDLLLQNQTKKSWRLLVDLYIKNVTLVDILSEVVSPALRHIGEEWYRGRIEIHDEHRMSFHAREHLVRLGELIPAPRMRSSAVLACISGDWHEIPLQVSSLILKSNGFNPIVLGVNTPEKEIISASKKWKAEITVVIKIYTENKQKEFLKDLEHFVLKEKKYLFYGGNGWTKKWRHLISNRSKKYIKHFGDLKLFANEVERLRGKTI